LLFEPLLLSGAACAAGLKQDGGAPPPASPFHVSGELVLASDYRQGGVTRSDGDPAIQGRFTVAHDDGWSVGMFASSMNGRQGSNAQVSLFGAKKFEFGETDVSIGATYVMFFGGEADPFAIAQASVTHPIGPAAVTLAVNYAPPQEALDDEYGMSVNLRARSPVGRINDMPLTAAVSIGRAEGEFAMGAEAKLDWSVGVTAEIADGVEFGIAYVDNDLDGERGDGGFVFSIAHRF
jgi:uncharacterized protein (TIGR02001 family)